MASTTTVNALVALAVVYGIAWVLLRSTQDSREPPTIDSSIPFITPLINMVAKGPRYFKSRSNVPFYTLRLPGQRMYIVNSTALIPLMNRKAPTISFEPILIKVAAGLMGFSKSGMDILEHTPQDGGHGLLEDSAKNTRVHLAPGTQLHALDRRLIKQIQSNLDLLVGESAKEPRTINLCEWLTTTITKISTETIYGPLNPMRDPANVQAWQDVGQGFIPLLVNILPSFVAGKSVQARQRLVDGFKTYYEKEGYAHPDTSALIRNRQALFQSRGMSNSDMARHEVAATLALLINTIPATFWFTYHLFSDAEALADCRRELAAGVNVDPSTGRRSIDLAFVKTSCPTLLSTFKETLRFHGINVAPRVILEDTLVDGRFLLKKGGVLLIPATVQHGLASVWGEDVDEFRYKRFVRDPEKGSQRLYDPSAFRVFGGGSVVCPGRYFATTEILSLAAMIILQFDVRPAAGGAWKMPTVEKSNPAISFQQPDYDVGIELHPRDEPPCEIVAGGSYDRVESSLAKEFNVE
ncbi:cytochrome P450 [Xylariaceae sp. FL0255]|nr:cytochrome P450 [Xylariaceae sp. FL0255]